MSVSADDVTAVFLPQIATYKDVPHQKCVICFAAVPGSGKTWLTSRLEQDLQAVNISNDDIRRAIEAAGPVDRNTRERIKEAVIRRINKQVVTWPNGLVLLDADVSRRYAKMLPRFPGYKIVIISIDAPKDLLIERIRNREGHRADPEKTIELLDKWIADKQLFMEQYGDKVTLQLDAAQGIDYESVKKQILSVVKA